MKFNEYLQYQPFTVRMDNNPLTYILTTPHLDALGHRWVAALASYNMKLEYLKGSDNEVADVLSRVSTQKLDEETVTELLNYTWNGSAPRAETANIHVIEEGKRVDQEVFVVPTADRQAAIDGCHHSVGHQGHDRTLSLMKERFWWPGMSQALLKAIANCGRCIQYEAKGQLPPMQPIICTEPMELVHIDYIRMEVTVATDKKPVVWNVLVVIDHFTHYVQAFIIKNHTVRTTARVLYNNYFCGWFSPMSHVGSRNGILWEGHCGCV